MRVRPASLSISEITTHGPKPITAISNPYHFLWQEAAAWPNLDGAVALFFKLAMAALQPGEEFIEAVLRLLGVGGEQRAGVPVFL